MESFNETVGATFVRNPHYWGSPAKPARIEMTFYPDEGPETSEAVA